MNTNLHDDIYEHRFEVQSKKGSFTNLWGRQSRFDLSGANFDRPHDQNMVTSNKWQEQKQSRNTLSQRALPRQPPQIPGFKINSEYVRRASPSALQKQTQINQDDMHFLSTYRKPLVCRNVAQQGFTDDRYTTIQLGSRTLQ